MNKCFRYLSSKPADRDEGWWGVPRAEEAQKKRQLRSVFPRRPVEFSHGSPTEHKDEGFSLNEVDKQQFLSSFL